MALLRSAFIASAVTARADLEDLAYGAFGAGRARAALELGGVGAAEPRGQLRLELTDARVHAYRRRTVTAACRSDCFAMPEFPSAWGPTPL